MENLMAQPDNITQWIETLPGLSPGCNTRKRRRDELSDTMEHTPMRRRKMTTPNTDTEDADPANTPRPQPIAQLSNAFQILHPSPSVSSTSSIRPSAAGSDTASSQSRAAKRRRSESPKKRLENLNLARYPVPLHSIGTVRELPQSAQKIA